MTLADCIEAVLLEQGPLPVCSIAPAVRKQKADVIATLNGNPNRFVHNGRKARASRWDVRDPYVEEPVAACVDDELDADELARRWQRELDLDAFTARSFVSHWVETGGLERVDGNGRVTVTEAGRELMASLMTGAGE